jgi:hypothetical protein
MHFPNDVLKIPGRTAKPGQLELEKAKANRELRIVCCRLRRPPVPAFDSLVEVRLADARNKEEVRDAISGATKGTASKMIKRLAMVSFGPGGW